MTDHHYNRSVPGAGVFAADVLNLGEITRLDNLADRAAGYGLPHPKHLPRTITFRYGPAHYESGTVTGIPVGFVAPGEVIGVDTEKPLRVLMTSAGCAHGNKAYEIPVGAVIEEVTI